VRISTFIVGLMVCGAVFGAGSTARADHETRFNVLWPKIYAPTITGNLFDDDEENVEDPAFRRRMKQRQALRQNFDVDDLEPRYERKKIKPAAPKKKIVRNIDDVKKPIAKPQVKAVSIKPEVKPVVQIAVANPVVIMPKLKPELQKIAALTPVKPEAAPKARLILDEPVVAPKASLPAVAAKPVASPNVIGCSKGVEIVTGYGFSEVKPKSCSGAVYAFDASRANAAYVITLSAATGEITDVKKL
jgi:hypothetical protein